jgi:hypothetical protein
MIFAASMGKLNTCCVKHCGGTSGFDQMKPHETPRYPENRRWLI